MEPLVPDYAVAAVPAPLRKRLLVAALVTALALAALALIGWGAFGTPPAAAPTPPPAAAVGTVQAIALAGDIPFPSPAPEWAYEKGTFTVSLIRCRRQRPQRDCD